LGRRTFGFWVHDKYLGGATCFYLRLGFLILLYIERWRLLSSWAELTCGFLHYRLVRTFRIATFWSIGQGRRLKMVIRGTNIDNSYVVVLLLWRETLPSIGSIVGKREVPPLHLPVLVFAFIVFCLLFFCFLGRRGEWLFFSFFLLLSLLYLIPFSNSQDEIGRAGRRKNEKTKVGGERKWGKKLYGDVCFYCAF